MAAEGQSDPDCTADCSVCRRISVCLIAEGFPSFMHLRSSVDMAPVFLSKPGLHYFYKDYETSYTYYTGETAVRLLPTLSA